MKRRNQWLSMAVAAACLTVAAGPQPAVAGADSAGCQRTATGQIQAASAAEEDSGFFEAGKKERREARKQRRQERRAKRREQKQAAPGQAQPPAQAPQATPPPAQH